MNVSPSVFNLRWIDACPSGVQRPELWQVIVDLQIATHTHFGAPGDDIALVVLDPSSAETIRTLIEDFRTAGRPVATLKPTSETRAEDLLIVAFDGLLAQSDDGPEMWPIDAALIALLRREADKQPDRYRKWLQQALLNAAIARMFEAETSTALSFFTSAMALGGPPDELSELDSNDLIEAFGPPESLSEEHRRRLAELQGWLLLSTTTRKSGL